MATVRQKMALAKLAENGGSVGQAMRDAGYSEVSSKTPSKLTNSIGWNELVEEHLPDAALVKVHKEGLGAFKYETQLTGKGESQIVKVPDFSVRHKYLETGYKVKGRYSDGGGNNILIVQLSETAASRYKVQPNSKTA